MYLWELSGSLQLMALPAYIILRMGNEILILIMIVAVTSYILKKNWFDKIENE